MRINQKAVVIGVCAGFASLCVQADPPPLPQVNHNVAAWTSNRPASSLKPDAYVCSPGSTLPAAAVLPISDRYDGTMLLPTPMEFAVPDLHIPAAEGTGPTLVRFAGLNTNGTETYVDYPFTTAAFATSDLVLNQAFYSLNSSTRHGSQFKIRMTLVDKGNSNAEYALGAANPMKPISNLLPAGIYFFVNNQTWPLSGAPGSMQTQGAFYCEESRKVTDQGIAGTVKVPVPLHAGHAYALRAYLSFDANATPISPYTASNPDTRAMIDDLFLYMQEISVEPQNDGLQQPSGAVDPAYSFPAANGGNTPAVQANDKISGASVPDGSFTLTQVSADPGLTLNTTTGTITAAAGQPGTKTLTYQLCPKYGDTVIPNFQSKACKQAVATVTLTGPPAPPTVSVSCTPSAIPDSQGGASVCAISAGVTLAAPLSVTFTPPATNSRYQSDCASPIVIPGGSSQATCNVTAVPNDVPGDGNVTATITLLPGAAYTIGTGTASVDVQDDDLSIVGSVQGAPATFPPALVGQTVNYSLTCAPGAAAPTSGQLTIGATGQLSASATHVPPGTSCTSMTVDGVAQLPAAPANYEWKSSTATLSGANAFAVTLVLAPKVQPETEPTPVPTLNSIGLTLLGLLAAGFGAFVLRRKTMS